ASYLWNHFQSSHSRPSGQAGDRFGAQAGRWSFRQGPSSRKAAHPLVAPRRQQQATAGNRQRPGPDTSRGGAPRTHESTCGTPPPPIARPSFPRDATFEVMNRFVVAFLCLTFAPPASAAVVRSLEMADLCRMSDVIARGVVVAAHT